MVIDVGPDLGEGLDTLPESGRDRSKKAKKSDDGAQPVAAKAFSEKTVSAVAASQKRRRQAKRRMEADEDPSKFSEAAAAEPGSLKRLARKQKDSLRAHKQSKSHLESVKTSGKVATERQAVSAATKQLESAQAAKKHCRAPNGSAPIFGGGEASPTTDAAPLGARKGRKTSEGGEIPPEEAKRRQRQRELRDLALKQRAEGKPYSRPNNKPAPKKIPEKAERSSINRKRPRFAADDEPGSRPDHPVEVIVVPIYWQSHPGEKDAVMEMAQQAAACLEGAAVKTGVDKSEAYTPGQKFGFWEEKGVMVRIECGPRDAAKQQCMLAISKKAGHVAPKRAYKVGPELLRAVGEALGKRLASAGKEQICAEFDAEPSGAETLTDDVPAVNSVRGVLGSGDDIGDDFGLLAADEPSKKQKKAKKKRMLA